MQVYCQFCDQTVEAKDTGAGVGVCPFCYERIILPKPVKSSKKKVNKRETSGGR